MTPVRMSVEPIVRLATINDAESLARLSGQLGYPTTTEEAVRRVREVNGQSEHAIYIAEADGTLVGWLHVFICHSLLADTPAEVAGLVVDEKYRGRSVGQILMHCAEQWAREHGCRSVRLRSNIVRSQAHEFYAKLGYRVLKTQKAFCKQLD